jgi:hypothetical protein
MTIFHINAIEGTGPTAYHIRFYLEPSKDLQNLKKGFANIYRVRVKYNETKQPIYDGVFLNINDAYTFETFQDDKQIPSQLSIMDLEIVDGPFEWTCNDLSIINTSKSRRSLPPIPTPEVIQELEDALKYIAIRVDIIILILIFLVFRNVVIK